MISFDTVAKALPYLVEGFKAIPEIENLVQEILRGFHSKDQVALKSILETITAEDDAAHEETQNKLSKAEKK